MKAGDVVKVAAQVAGGGGGGRDTMAQAGGRDPEKLARGLAAPPARRSSAAPRLASCACSALDYGSARCGCALSDPTGTLATPIEPIERPGDPQGPGARRRRSCASARSSASSSACRSG